MKWAIARGVIDPADYFVPIRYLRIVSPLEECNESVAYVYDEVDAADNSIPANGIERSDESVSKTKSRNTIHPFTKEEATGDVSRWIDFNKMASYVTEVHLFYKLEYFQCSIQVTGDTVKTINETRRAADAKETKREKRGTIS